MFAAAPLNKDLTPSVAMIFLAQSIDPLYFYPSPEVIIILLLTVSIGYEAKPAPTVTVQPNKKLTSILSLKLAGRLGFTESQIPKQRPLQMTIPTHEITNPLQRPAIPSLASVFLYTSINPLNCFAPPFLALFKSLVNLVLAQSKEQTNKSETEPAAPPDAKLPANQTQYPSLSLFLPNNLLKQSLNEKFKAWVGKYLRTLVKFPFHKALTPYSAETLVATFIIPVYGTSRAPDFNMASIFWSLSLMSSIGAAMVFETAAETPPIKNSIAKVVKSFFFQVAITC